MAAQQSDGVAVVMVPLPAQGHLNQMLHLTRILSAQGLPVHYIGSATHNRQAKDRVHGWDPVSVSNVRFHDFEIPQFSNPPPDPQARDKIPVHFSALYEACMHLREPLGLLLRSLSSTNKRVVVIHDTFMAFAAEEASFVSNAEAFNFNPMPAFAMFSLLRGISDKPIDEDEEYCVSFENTVDQNALDILPLILQWMKFSSGEIYNTCTAIEGRFINRLMQLRPDKKLWAVGPFNPVSFDTTEGPRHSCLEWLDKQPPESVIYVSFGTMTSISDEQIAELAVGLERSEQRFIWALRDADRADIYKGEVRKAPLPDGFEERVKGVGLIVRDWAPQLHILAHPSTGGFMSHCGWNSTMESLSMGVPVAAWPMHSDQPSIAVLVTGLLKVGLLVREWSRRYELISSDIIESSVRKLMLSEEGNTMRKRANELGTDVRRAVSHGGTSATQLESFIAQIYRVASSRASI